MSSLAAHSRWEIPEIATFSEGPGGLTQLLITSPLASARIFLHGAHVAEFQPTGEAPVLFMSAESLFASGKAIRGGVPVIFPWFGAHSSRPELPAHGFARTSTWEVEALSARPDGAVLVTLRLDPNAATRALWPHEFILRHEIIVGTALEMTLVVENTSTAPLVFEEALHTYFAISDAREIAVRGLHGAEYIDKTDNQTCKREETDFLRFTSETDRVFLQTEAVCTLEDTQTGRRIVVEKSGSASTVVWNPWIAKAATMRDFGDDEWLHMCCVETANVATDAITLAPGATHRMAARLRAAH